MLLISYDISCDKLRTKFAKYLMQFGHRLQYSLFEIKNSPRLLAIIKLEIESNFAKQFDQSDSVMIFHMSKQCKIIKYGYAKNDDSDLLVIG